MAGWETPVGAWEVGQHTTLSPLSIYDIICRLTTTNDIKTGFILLGFAKKLRWLKPELIECLSMVGIVGF